MIFFERIKKIIDYYGIKSINSFAKDYLSYKSSEKINRLKGENALPSYEILHDISMKFEEINPDWLLTGRGEMLRKATPNAADSEKKDKVCEKCAEKDKTIEAMQTTIATQATLIEYLKEMNGSLDVAQKKSSAASLPLNE